MRINKFLRSLLCGLIVATSLMAATPASAAPRVNARILWKIPTTYNYTMSGMQWQLWSIASFKAAYESQREIERVRHLVATQIATLMQPMPKMTTFTANTFQASALRPLPLSSANVAKMQVAPIHFVSSPFHTVAPFLGNALCAPESGAVLEPLDSIVAPDIVAEPLDTDSKP
ncbi:MAG: hypothetical protein J6X70_03170 [Muribaculaceae bacterium]|nr:hypothetical protein [Muribaculaceae bacterium]